jgi:hypothetical protein
MLGVVVVDHLTFPTFVGNFLVYGMTVEELIVDELLQQRRIKTGKGIT